jgi:hypothetical protein
MNALLKKLNFKTQKQVLVLNEPESFKEELEDFAKYLVVNSEIKLEKYAFCLIFVTEQLQIESLAQKTDAILDQEGLFWWAYPKGSSKKYKSDINRDNCWQIMGKLGYEPVRMVAIDEDWSALRFKKAELIKKITREPSWIMTEIGKAKAANKKS